MKQNRIYNKVEREYWYLHTQKRSLMMERDRINAQIEVIENVLGDLNNILCEYGNHLYEHFEESETHESEE